MTESPQISPCISPRFVRSIEGSGQGMSNNRDNDVPPANFSSCAPIHKQDMTSSKPILKSPIASMPYNMIQRHQDSIPSRRNFCTQRFPTNTPHDKTLNGFQSNFMKSPNVVIPNQVNRGQIFKTFFYLSYKWLWCGLVIYNKLH